MDERASVKDLIETIKKEGIQEASKQGEDIVKSSEKKAEQIVINAREEAKTILDDAKVNAQKVKDGAEKAMAQAARNLVISLKQEITALFQKVTQRKIAKALNPSAVKDLIVLIIEKWEMSENFPGVEILVGKQNLKELEEHLKKALSEEWKNGVVIKPVDSVQAGFQIGEKDGNVHYNFTDKGITEILSEYLNPQMAKFLEESSKEN